MAQASAAGGESGSGGASLRVRVQKFGSFLSGMVMPTAETTLRSCVRHCSARRGLKWRSVAKRERRPGFTRIKM